MATITATGQTGIRWARGIAVDQHGKIYVANGADGGNRIAVFPAGSRGNVAPMATIEGSDTGIDNPIGVAADSHGKIFITNGAKTFVTKENRLDQGPSSITSYAAGSNGDVKPIVTITGVSKSYVPGRFIGFQFYLPSRPGSPEQLAKEWQGTFEGIGPVPGRKLWVWNQMPVNGGTPHVTMYVIGKDGDVTRKSIGNALACLVSPISPRVSRLIQPETSICLRQSALVETSKRLPSLLTTAPATRSQPSP